MFFSKFFGCKSQNGRWGIEIVATEESVNQLKEFLKVDTLQISFRYVTAIPGYLKNLGTVNKFENFKYTFSDPKNNQWVIIGEDLDPIKESGAVLVTSLNLQGSNTCSIIAAANGGIWKSYGYKGRSSKFQTVVNGEVKDVPNSILLATGVIQPKEAPEDIETPKQSSAFAEAFKKAGINL